MVILLTRIYASTGLTPQVKHIFRLVVSLFSFGITGTRLSEVEHRWDKLDPSKWLMINDWLGYILKDAWSDSKGFINLDNQNDCQLLELKQSGKMVRFLFQRDFVTCDRHDKPLEVSIILIVVGLSFTGTCSLSLQSITRTEPVISPSPKAWGPLNTPMGSISSEVTMDSSESNCYHPWRGIHLSRKMYGNWMSPWPM